jgi:hypothetical protein
MPRGTAEFHFLVNLLLSALMKRDTTWPSYFQQMAFGIAKGRILEGPAGIRTALEGRPRELTTRHL